jgi:glycerol-3-phosphate dehydrogenase
VTFAQGIGVSYSAVNNNAHNAARLSLSGHDFPKQRAVQVAFAIDEEVGVTLTDVLARRTMVGIGPTLPDETVDRVTSVAARIAGWTDERAARERDAYTDRLDRFRLPDGATAGLRPPDRALSA